ncbi:hypothetical protein NDU88_003153 [Pleurodeles waltl]|uniref:Transmembrane protein 14A n=1 Tax=Pleurodeles waltl TaxID=8319 RepID=A0AAV7RC35_PLEWA|nr:hypothetical protein NDU88_003153 [Pleurodeles waltl]
MCSQTIPFLQVIGFVEEAGNLAMLMILPRPENHLLDLRSLVSLAAGLFFGFVAAYGALCITYNSRNVTPSFFVAFIMAIVMGVRYRRSRKVMPAGIVAGLSLFMILRLVCMLL